MQRPIPLVLAVGAIITSGGFLTSGLIRSESPVYNELGHVTLVWHLLLLAGGVATIYGNQHHRLKAEAFGLVLVAGGSIFYVVGAFFTRGWAAWTAGTLIMAASIAALLRAYALTQGRTWS